nr:RNA-directed DNA polymerase, eukaryota, reverse transcriptase zinc-binding domain protein [Tanacetum cinerariifolium]
LFESKNGDVKMEILNGGLWEMSMLVVSVMIVTDEEGDFGKKKKRFLFWGSSQGSKKLAWIKWTNILASYEKGGLAIGSLKSFNIALLQKWRWRLYSCPDLLWVKIIRTLHGSEGGFYHNGCNFKAYLNNLLIEIGQLEVETDKDKCVWSLAHDGVFSVADLRRQIDDHILPSLDSKMTWDKTLP